MSFRMAEFRKVTTAGWVGAIQCEAVRMLDPPLHFDTSDPSPLEHDPNRPGGQCGDCGKAHRDRPRGGSIRCARVGRHHRKDTYCYHKDPGQAPAVFEPLTGLRLRGSTMIGVIVLHQSWLFHWLEARVGYPSAARRNQRPRLRMSLSTT
jgi:hypothetical protein